jgi:hypothetical protein
MYTLKNIKSFKGHEGEPCAQGTLHGLKGKAADWSDDSWGGPMRIDFVNPEAEEAFVVWASTYLPTIKDFDDKPFNPANMDRYSIIESAVAQMSYIAMELKLLEKEAKKGIAYYRTDTSNGEGKTLYVTNAAYTAENVAALRKKYPDLLEIVNERFAMPYVDAAVAEKAAENKRYKQLCKTTILYSLREADGTVKVMQMKTPYTSARATALRAAHKNLIEIINERYL